MPGRRARSVVVPFPVHQVLDYLGGLYLLDAGAHLSGRAATVCYAAGAVVLLAATLSGRPLGVGRLARPCHRVADIAFIAWLPAAPFVFVLTGDAPALIHLDWVAAALVAPPCV